MCLCIASEQPRKLLVAEKPIRVYKVLDIHGNSIYQEFKYERGYHYYEKISEHELQAGIINRGLHSFTNPQRAKEDVWGSDQVVEMWVPKGAKYIKGDDQDLVSTQLVFYPKAK